MARRDVFPDDAIDRVRHAYILRLFDIFLPARGASQRFRVSERDQTSRSRGGADLKRVHVVRKEKKREKKKEASASRRSDMRD